MAEETGYGRSGIAVGGKGGMKIGGVYDFGAKSAGEYLSGGLASQYTQASNVLRSDIAGGVTGENINQLSAKLGAKQKIGKLRDIAQANAVGEFRDFAESKGRGSQAMAANGLITGETYAPTSTSGFESAASQNYYGSGHGGVPSKYGKSMAYTLGANAATMHDAIMGVASPVEFGASGPVSYIEAAAGKTGALNRALTAEGQAVEAAKSSGSTSGMFQEAADKTVAPIKPQAGRTRKSVGLGELFSNKTQVERNKQVEQARQSILAMTPAERYLQGVTNG